MTDFRPSAFLRRVLLADAATCAAAGLLMLAGAGLLEPLLGLPSSFLRYAGASLIPFVALLVFAAMRDNPGRGVIWAIIAANAAWVIGSFELLLLDWFAPTLLGTLFVVAQALTVALLAALEYVGLRQSAVSPC